MADRFSQLLTLVALFVTASLLPVPVCAQQGTFHQPLNQRTPPGLSAGWLTHIRGHQSSWLQPVRIQVPGGAEVSVYSGPGEPAAIATSPARVAVNPGHTYRLRLAHMPEFPDAELYPSIEILDRLHPPAGKEHKYPVPVPFSRDDIRLALAGRLVTRVIYLEQPQLAQQLDPLNREIPQTVLPSENVLQEADRLGRPMIIIRLGARRPLQIQSSSMFFGTGGAAQLSVNDESAQQRFPRISKTAMRTR
ncbi:MAG: hypothetical protein MK102_00170 [Fuerstiella sp.]|nr:hypothetical protein [Fuerstiella sp.]